MARQHTLTVADQRAATPRLRWLQLQAPDLAREVRPGQLLMLRCAEPGATDPPLRRALFVAAAEPALGQVALLFAPEGDPGLRWLARARAGDEVDALGPLGRPFAIDQRTRAMLLVGEGPGLAALMLLARAVVARGGAATLICAAPEPDLLPPAFLLPGAVEYQSGQGPAVELLAQSDPRTTVAWADQLAAALPVGQAPRLRDIVRAGRLRADRSFASVLAEAPIPCGLGVCGACAVETPRGQRLACASGPVFELRELA